MQIGYNVHVLGLRECGVIRVCLVTKGKGCNGQPLTSSLFYCLAWCSMRVKGAHAE
jgi:hypothetical protein